MHFFLSSVFIERMHLPTGSSETGNTIHHVDVVFNSREFPNKKKFFSNNEPFAKEKHSLVRSHFADGFIPKRHSFDSRVSNGHISSLHFSSVLTTDGHIRGGPICGATKGLLLTLRPKRDRLDTFIHSW